MKKPKDEIVLFDEGDYMIAFVTRKIFNFVSNNIEMDDVKKQIYQYGIELCISTIINVLLIAAAGMILGCFVESLIFLIIFIVLRQYTGGYHADTYLKCNLVFLATFLLVLLISKMLMMTLDIAWLMIAAAVAAVVVGLLAPIENPNKPVSDRVRFRSKIVSIVLWILLCASAGYLGLCGWRQYGVVILVTILSIMVLMIIGELKERRLKNE